MSLQKNNGDQLEEPDAKDYERAREAAVADTQGEQKKHGESNDAYLDRVAILAVSTWYSTMKAANYVLVRQKPSSKTGSAPKSLRKECLSGGPLQKIRRIVRKIVSLDSQGGLWFVISLSAFFLIIFFLNEGGSCNPLPLSQRVEPSILDHCITGPLVAGLAPIGTLLLACVTLLVSNFATSNSAPVIQQRRFDSLAAHTHLPGAVAIFLITLPLIAVVNYAIVGLLVTVILVIVSFYTIVRSIDFVRNNKLEWQYIERETVRLFKWKITEQQIQEGMYNSLQNHIGQLKLKKIKLNVQYGSPFSIFKCYKQDNFYDLNCRKLCKIISKMDNSSCLKEATLHLNITESKYSVAVLYWGIDIKCNPGTNTKKSEEKQFKEEQEELIRSCLIAKETSDQNRFNEIIRDWDKSFREATDRVVGQNSWSSWGLLEQLWENASQISLKLSQAPDLWNRILSKTIIRTAKSAPNLSLETSGEIVSLREIFGHFDKFLATVPRPAKANGDFKPNFIFNNARWALWKSVDKLKDPPSSVQSFEHDAFVRHRDYHMDRWLQRELQQAEGLSEKEGDPYLWDLYQEVFALLTFWIVENKEEDWGKSLVEAVARLSPEKKVTQRFWQIYVAGIESKQFPIKSQEKLIPWQLDSMCEDDYQWALRIIKASEHLAPDECYWSETG